MRNIKYIVVHCTAGSSTQKTTDILKYWKDKLGWKQVGYHYLINENGVTEQLADESVITNGVKGYNSNSIHICYKGGWNGKDTRTELQKSSLKTRLTILKIKYPKAEILGHRDLSLDLNKDGKITSNEWTKSCPCFDAKKEYKNLK
jgi:N-acetylmuramoyl-L-alanine amidase